MLADRQNRSVQPVQPASTLPHSHPYPHPPGYQAPSVLCPPSSYPPPYYGSLSSFESLRRDDPDEFGDDCCQPVPHERLPSYRSFSNFTVHLRSDGSIRAIGPTVPRSATNQRYPAYPPLLAAFESPNVHYGPPGVRSAPHRCPASRTGHTFVDEYAYWGILAAIFCFPVGLICCWASRDIRCLHCGIERPMHTYHDFNNVDPEETDTDD